ncbi:MAG: ATP-binding protein [Myxococcales bacterium]|nr:ATP-binding protein [Myxococcales bacterium]
MSDPSTRYAAALERVRLRALRAAELGSAQRPERLAELAAQLDAVERALVATAGGARDGALARRLGLGLDELDLLWTTVAVTADPRLWPHLQRLGGAEAARGASLGLHALLAELDLPRSLELGLTLGPDHPLVRFGLIEPADELAWAARAFRAAPRVARHLAGDDTLDALVAELGGLVRVPDGLELDDAVRDVHARLGRALAGPTPVLCAVDGSPGVGRRTAIAVAAAAAGRPALALELGRLPAGPGALERALAALTREAVLTGAVPVVVGVDELVGESGAAPELRTIASALDRVPGPVAVVTLSRGVELPVTRTVLRVSVPVPETAARRRLWARALDGRHGPPVAADALDALAIRYRLGAGAIAQAVRAAVVMSGDALGAPELIAGVRNNIAERMGGLAQRVTVKQRWDELVLGRDTLDQVKALTARVRHQHTVLERWGLSKKLHRGTGVAALFSGPPGTGKTMVAGLIATELDLELYQVDLSRVVSKWVGETEKQLARIFDAADAGHALLLFDEADALFARRTEVKAAVDRYANLEVNYLLQRVEAFGGITILTTNLDQSIDPALMRRLSGHVKFWPPEQDERELLWRSMLGPAVPQADDLDLEELASRFSEMTGANIRNAAIAAAFLAAAEGVPVSQALLERAARGEYASMGRQLGGQSR